MEYKHIYYTTHDKLLDIEFFFLNLGEEDGWRAYILSDIDYKQFSPTRSDDIDNTHMFIKINCERYIDKNKDYPYVCWTEPIHSLEGIMELARRWAEIIAYYIRYGGTFEEIEPILERRGIL